MTNGNVHLLAVIHLLVAKDQTGRRTALWPRTDQIYLGQRKRAGGTTTVHGTGITLHNQLEQSGFQTERGHLGLISGHPKGANLLS